MAGGKGGPITSPGGVAPRRWDGPYDSVRRTLRRVVWYGTVRYGIVWVSGIGVDRFCQTKGQDNSRGLAIS